MKLTTTKKESRVSLTISEALAICNMLYTLQSLGGAGEEEFENDTERAGKFADKLFKIINQRYHDNN